MTRLLFVEPYYSGTTHAAFNAALLEAARMGLSPTVSTVVGEKRHLAAMRSVLADAGGESTGRTKFVEMSRVGFESDDGGRALGGANEIVREALRSAADVIFAGSFSAALLVSLRLTLTAVMPSCLLVGICHDVLEKFLVRAPTGARDAAMQAIRARLLNAKYPTGSAIVVLGGGIARRVEAQLDRGERSLFWIDPPCLLGSSAALREASRRKRTGPYLNVGFVGTTYNSGWSRFAAVTSSVAARVKNVTFAAVGYRRSASASDGSLGDVPNEPLEWPEFVARFGGLDAVVGLADGRAYEKKASAAVVDAIVSGKPGFYLRTPYIADLEAEGRSPGWIYEKEEDLVAGLSEFAASDWRSRLASESVRLARVAPTFGPAAVGKQIARVVAIAGASL